HPVFQVSFVVQSFGNVGKVSDDQRGYFRSFEGATTYEATKFDLSIFINDSGEDITGQISYATSLFHKDTIVRLIDHYTYLVGQLVEFPRKSYSELSLLTPESYNRLVYEWNDTYRAYP
ncbi:condensation domain-containing protein, partial [uncultured Aquimarina sp.]|uniref:condensation domain-containing protein n=1 Tax=uncultured Aquimarina sp. TaxID=575652 RepID=UPI002633AE56